MGALLGLLLGTGLLLIWQSLGPERHCKSTSRWVSMPDRARETLVQAGNFLCQNFDLRLP